MLAFCINRMGQVSLILYYSIRFTIRVDEARYCICSAEEPKYERSEPPGVGGNNNANLKSRTDESLLRL